MAFLDASCEAYDRGSTREAYRLATTIRVLVHDTSRSHSLLSQMLVKDKISYIDGRLPSFDNLSPLGAEAVNSAPGLAVIAHFYRPEGNTKNTSEYWPAFRMDANEISSQQRVAFDTWWKTAVCVDTLGHSQFRRNFILAAANKDGGAHIDPEFGPDLEGYRAMTREGSMGTRTNGSYVVSGGPPDSGATELSPALAIIRQIAEELRVSIRLQLADSLGNLSQTPLGVEMERPFMVTGDRQWNMPEGFTLQIGPQPD